MHGKILIVDPIATNRIVLKVKLSAAHYSVAQASSAAEALRMITTAAPDIVMTACDLPDATAAEFAAQVRRHAQSHDLPMLAILSDGAQGNLHALLEAGFDDVVPKPLDDQLLLARVRSLVRVYNAAAEWRMRDDTSRALGLAEAPQAFHGPAQVTVISDSDVRMQKWAHRLKAHLQGPLRLARPTDDLAPEGPGIGPVDANVPDVFILDVACEHTTHLAQMLSNIRTHAKTRHSGILVVLTRPDAACAAQALDLGASDVMLNGFDPSELALRTRALVRRKQLSDQLRASVRTGLEAAVCDPLTGLHNRRYAMPHLTRIAERASRSGKEFAVMLADMDHFKRINDVFGHAAGDAVLQQVATRLRENLRAVDMIARIGGEEFLIVMPGTPLTSARQAAKRLCQVIENAAFDIPGPQRALNATVSIGLAIGDARSHAAFGPDSVASGLLDQADKALYRAKDLGRNQVTLSRPAA